MSDRGTVGIGWVEVGEGSAVPGTREQALNFAAGLPLPCSMIRSDKTEPKISSADFATDGPARRCDVLMLSGHGGGSSVGFLLPGDEALKFDTVKFGGDQRCVVIAACSIFEGNDVLEDPKAWGNTFDGLHMLIAPKTFIGASPGRSARFAKYLSDGLSFVCAWKLACGEAGTASGESDEGWAVMFPGTEKPGERTYPTEGLEPEEPSGTPANEFALLDIF